MKKWQIFLGLILSLCWLPIANAVTAQASVSTSIVGVNQAIELTVSIDKKVDSDALDLSALREAFVVGRPQVSSSYQNINGKSSTKTQWILAIAPKKAGRAEIPVFSIDGYKTRPIRLEVRQDAQSAQSATQEKDLIIKASLDRANIYEGETTLLHLTMYLGVELQNARIEPPQAEGVTLKQLGKDKQYRTQISGRNYMGVDVTYQVIPEKAGDIKIKGAVLSGEKITGRSGFFNAPALAIPVQAQGNTLEIKVIPKPENIAGVWLPTAKLSVTQSWQPDLSGLNGNSLKVGSPIERNIELRAKGVDVLKMPDIHFNYPSSLKVYEEKPEFSVEGDETVMRLKQVIIARRSGEVSLPGLDVNWFNTEKGEQEKSHIDGLTVNVLPDPDQKKALPSVVVPAQNLGAVSQKGTQCPAPPQVTDSGQVEKTPVYWIFATLFFAFLWLATLFFYMKSNKKPVIPIEKRGGGKDKLDIKHCRELIKNREDIALIQYLHEMDLSLYPPELVKDIEAELKQMQSSRYAREKNAWSGEKLLRLLKALHGKTKDNKAELAKL